MVFAFFAPESGWSKALTSIPMHLERWALTGLLAVTEIPFTADDLRDLRDVRDFSELSERSE